MKPGQKHIVATIEDSIAFGGHFYSLDSMGATLRAMVYEHESVRVAANTEHPRAYIQLIQLVMGIRDCIERGAKWFGESS